ncbi:MAG: ABC transporter permease, partial [Clostridium sp.]|nr:ABC transporter permease [Clostridium sp.]
MIKDRVLKFFKSLYGAIIIIVLWYLLSLGIGTNMVPTPRSTLLELIRLIQNDFMYHILYSLYRILGAIFVSLIIGIPLGILIGRSVLFDKIISPIVYLLYPIPK